MADRQFPKPNYDNSIEKLVTAYKQAMQDILRELERLDIGSLSYANAQAALLVIAEILKELDKTSSSWINEHIPTAVKDGVANTLYSLGVAKTVEEAVSIASFNKLNRELVKAVIADTQSDLLAVTQNVSRKVRATVRQVTADSMRANMAKGINGRRTISSDILTGLRQQLGSAVETGIIDAAGRRWKPEVYVDMAVRTKMMTAHLDSTINEAIARDALYGRISINYSKHEACRIWEGKIVKLTLDAPGDYPTLDEVKSGRGIFHPNCKHVISPTRLPNGIE
jgi:hypothetical protein